MALQPISDKEYPRNLGNTFPFACFFFNFALTNATFDIPTNCNWEIKALAFWIYGGVQETLLYRLTHVVALKEYVRIMLMFITVVGYIPAQFTIYVIITNSPCACFWMDTVYGCSVVTCIWNLKKHRLVEL